MTDKDAHTLAFVTGVMWFLIAIWAGAAPVTISGQVTNAQTGAPLANCPIGAVRTIALGTGNPEDLIPVEVSGQTNASGVFSYTVDSALPGLDRVLVFTMHPGTAFINQIYDGAPYDGQRPTYADIAQPGIVEFDCRSDVGGIDFALEPIGLPDKTTHMVEMSDGVRLATDVYLPLGSGPWPVVLYRTTYNKNTDGNRPGDEFRLRGYALVVQDCRGLFASEGIFRMFLDDGWGEKKDGYETVLWIRAQPWSNGQIATYGGSARGITQYMLAGSDPPGLVCQYVKEAGSDLYSQGLFHDGAFRKNLIENWTMLRGPEVYDLVMDMVTHSPFYNDELYAYVNFETRYHLVNWPMVHRAGWYDLWLRGAINSFVNIQHHGGPGARGRQKLIIEAYGHANTEGGFVWPNARKPPAPYDDIADWIDHWVKDIDMGMMEDPPVCYYVLGDVDDPNAPGNEWRYADDWPVPATGVAYYFHAGGLLSTSPPTVQESHQSYTFDPNDPVPTIGGANNFGTKGPYDQRPVESRPDVLLFTTPPLSQYVEVCGKVIVRLWASSSAVDTDFTAKLCDVYPDGRSMIVCDGIVRARHRNTMRSAEFLVPGEVYEFEIDLWETCIAFNAGHRIRVAISSSNYDRYDVNPNTGEPWNQHTHMQTAMNTIYHDAARLSHILLPVTSEIGAPPEKMPATAIPGLAVIGLLFVVVAGVYFARRQRSLPDKVRP